MFRAFMVFYFLDKAHSGLLMSMLSLYTSRTYLKSNFTMLEFWFDPKVSIARKLMIFVITAIVTAALYMRQALALNVILMFLAIGIIFLICRYCKVHFLAQRPRHLFTRLTTWLPIALLLSLIFAKAQQSLLILGAQGIGFMTLAVCLFSPLSLLNNNQERQA